MIAILFLAFAIVIAFYVLKALGRIIVWGMAMAMLCGVLMVGVVVVDKVVTFFSPTTHVFGEPVKVAQHGHKGHRVPKAKAKLAHKA